MKLWLLALLLLTSCCITQFLTGHGCIAQGLGTLVVGDRWQSGPLQISSNWWKQAWGVPECGHLEKGALAQPIWLKWWLTAVSDWRCISAPLSDIMVGQDEVGKKPGTLLFWHWWPLVSLVSCDIHSSWTSFRDRNESRWFLSVLEEIRISGKLRESN